MDITSRSTTVSPLFGISIAEMHVQTHFARGDGQQLLSFKHPPPFCSVTDPLREDIQTKKNFKDVTFDLCYR